MADTKNTDQRYWTSLDEQRGESRIEELKQSEFSEAAAEAPGLPQDGLSRRRFLSMLGASAALAATGSGCSRDIDRGSIVPYTNRPAEVTPGVATWYASSWSEGLECLSVLVKTREARPILIEGNDSHAATGGAINARAQGELLGLYDPQRLTAPTRKGEATTWDEAGKALKMAMAGKVLLLGGAVQSPTLKGILDDLQKQYPGFEYRSWEAAAPHGAIAASREVFGEELIPELHLEKATSILCLEADILGGEGEGLKQIRGFAAGRRLKNRGEASKFSNRLWAVESRMTLTGGKSDERLQLRASRMAAFVFALAKSLNARGMALPADVEESSLGTAELKAFAAAEGMDAARLDALLDDLIHAGSSAVVVAGQVLPAEAHAAVMLLNRMLGGEGKTFSYRKPALAPLMSPAEFTALQKEMAAGRYNTVIVWNVDPAHTSMAGSDFLAAMKGARQSFRLAMLPDATSSACEWQLPVNHWLESWGDLRGGLLQQPAVGTLFDTRQAEDLLLGLLPAGGSMEDRLKAGWTQIWQARGASTPFTVFWNSVLHDGWLADTAADAVKPAFNGARLAGYQKDSGWNPKGGLEVVVFADRRLLDGRHANNGWLQELPDPVTKCTWGNPLSISPADAKSQGISDGEILSLNANGKTLEVIAHVQPGQAKGTAAIAMGYGREGLDVAAGIGVNVNPLMAGPRPCLLVDASISASGVKHETYTTQEHHLMEGRDLVRSLPLAAYIKGANGAPHHGGHEGEALKTGHDHGVEHDSEPLTLYPDHEYTGHKWGMSIDLTTCVGCASCVIACQAENNIPMVGPERVAEGREMHWMRIDRYYEGSEDDPDMVFQPMLCQHCDHAPCENVCPVAATTHNEEGLNQMTYNRCVGTRYCANNCPYKVRRFNYFDYTGGIADTLQLAMNPEVSIRPRGVMEKCTFCAQRINDAKNRAKGEARELRDGDVTTACAAACPAGAITFGDTNDHHSRVSQTIESDRTYGVLEELGVRPAISYLAEVKNPVHSGGAHES